MIQDTHVTGHDLIFQNSSSWNINTISMVGDNNHSSLKKTTLES